MLYVTPQKVIKRREIRRPGGTLVDAQVPQPCVETTHVVYRGRRWHDVLALRLGTTKRLSQLHSVVARRFDIVLEVHSVLSFQDISHC